MSTRVRLSFQVAPALHRRFAGLFQDHLADPLQRLGLRDPEPADRPQAPGCFVRLYRLSAPDPGLASRLRRDGGWRRALARLPAGLGAAGRDFYRITPYSAPAGPGRTVDCGAGYRQGPWHGFSVQDGLPSSLITGLFQDRLGRLWLCTHESGACRFDGETFTTFRAVDGLAHDHVDAIVEDTDGSLWFVTAGGLCRFDGIDFDTFTVEDGLPGDAPSALLLTAAGQLWVAGQGGVARFDGDSFRPLPGGSPEGVTSLLEDQKGQVWLGSRGGLWQWDGRALARVAIALPQSGALSLRLDRRGRVWANTEAGPLVAGPRGAGEGESGCVPADAQFLLEDGRGWLWFSGPGGLVARRASDGEEVFRCDPPSLPSVPNRGLVDGHGHVWFVDPFGSGAWHFDGQGMSRYTTREGLGHNRVFAILEDRSGNLWLGSWGGGLNRYDGHRLTTYTEEDGLAFDEVEAVATDGQGRLWFATRGRGASCYDGAAFTALTAADGLAGDFLWCVLHDSRGRLWFGSNGGGATCLDGDTLTTYTTADGLVHNTIWTIFEDSRSRIWFTSQGGGASCLEGGTFTTYGVRDGLPHDWVWSVAEDAQGRMWFATGGGVSRFDGRTFTNYTTADGLAHDNVWCCRCGRDGRVWFGTWGGGASVWDPVAERFTNYTTADGLADDNVRSIYQDRTGRLWFSTYGGGVSLYDGQVFQTFSRKDGLVHDAVQDVFVDPRGQAWIATEAGVTCYRPPSTPPGVRLRGVIADQSYGAVAAVDMPSSQKFVLFEFRGSSFTTPRDRLAFVYRLRGAHDDWRTTFARRVEYRDLPVGSYRFEVRAVDRDLNYSEPVDLCLTVHPDLQQDRMEALEAQLSQPQGLEHFIGGSLALQGVLDQLHTVADTDVTVLILGETGTGKGLAARAIHAVSRRAAEPFLQVNCGAIPEGLMESELFGHEKGAFTGAVSRKIGRFELADGGTLFLDEVGDLPLESQQVLLQVLQDGTIQRVGGRESIHVEARIIAATNRDLEAAMRRGTFREDLYFRLSAFVVHLPPLRRRQEDIPLLVEHFVERFARHLHRPVPEIDPLVLDYLKAYGWPGNVRELEHVVQRAILVCRDGKVRIADLFLSGADPVEQAPDAARLMSLDEQQRRFADQQRQLIEAALQATGGVVYGEAGAARLLGTHPEKLRVRMRKLGVRRLGVRRPD